MGNLDLADIATIAEAIFVIISVIFIAVQTWQTKRLAKTANTQSLVEISAPFNLQLIQDREMAEFWVKGAELEADMDEVDRYRYRSLLVWWLILHENIYYQRKQRLLDDKTYAPWKADLEQFVIEHHLETRWGKMRKNFQVEFADQVQMIIDK